MLKSRGKALRGGDDRDFFAHDGRIFGLLSVRCAEVYCGCPQFGGRRQQQRIRAANMGELWMPPVWGAATTYRRRPFT